MVKYSPNFKHNILTLYQPNVYNKGFKSLSTQFKIQGGAQTIKNWYDRWDGTEQSLNRHPTTGRKPILNTTQIRQFIKTPIRKKNQTHKPIHYQTIYQNLKKTINKQISLRTVQRYGKETFGIKQRTTKKCMSRECKYMQTKK